MKLCFSTLGCVEQSAAGVVGLAKKHGIDHVELRGLDGSVKNREIASYTREKRSELREFFEKESVTPVVLGSSCSFHDRAKTEEMLAEGEYDAALARDIGIKYIRVFGNRITSDDTPGLVAGSVSELCRRAPDVNVLLEIHGDFNTAEALSPLLERLSEVDNFGLIWDVAHTFRAYRKDFSTIYPLISRFVRHVHIKDAVAGADRDTLTLVGQGEIPILPIVDRLLSDDYDGCFSLEWEKAWHPELPSLDEALDGFVTVMSKASC